MKWQYVMNVIILTILIGFLALLAIELNRSFFVLWGLFLVILGLMILSPNKLGRELRGETKPETVRRFDPIAIGYVVWIIVCHLIDPSYSNYHYLIMFSGILVITFVWHELDLKRVWYEVDLKRVVQRIKELWWKMYKPKGAGIPEYREVKEDNDAGELPDSLLFRLRPDYREAAERYNKRRKEESERRRRMVR